MALSRSLLVFSHLTLNISLTQSSFFGLFSSPFTPFVITSHLYHIFENYFQICNSSQDLSSDHQSHRCKSSCRCLISTSHRYLTVSKNKLLIYPPKLALLKVLHPHSLHYLRKWQPS